MKIIFKKLISAVTTVALLAGYTMSVVAENKDTVLFAENYDGATCKEHIKGTGELVTDSATGNKYMMMDMTISGVTDKYETAFAYSIPSVSEGIVKVKFDYMTNATTKESYMLLANSSKRSGGEWLRLLGAANGKLSAFSNSHIFGNVTAGKWYTYEATINMDTHEVSAVLVDKNSGASVGSMSATLERTSSSYSDWPRTSNEFVELRHYGDNDAYIDNVEIKSVYIDPTFVFGEDYEGATYTKISSGTGSIVTDEGTGNKYMKMTGAWSASQFGHSIPSLSKGKIKIEFDYMKNNVSKQTYIVLTPTGEFYAGKKWLRLLGVSSSGDLSAFTHNKSIGKMKADTWYTHKAIINLDTHEVSAEIYEKGADTPLGTIHYDKLPDFAEMNSSYGYTGWPEDVTEFVCLRHFGDADGYLDNVKINYVYDDPVLDADDVTIQNDEGIEQMDRNDVIYSAKTIKINFGTTMRDNTISGDTVFVTKKNDSEKVSANVDYEDGVVTLTADNNWDTAEYTIHVKKDVANFLGVTMTEDFELDFTAIKSKVVKAVLTDAEGNEILHTENLEVNPEISKLSLYLEGDIDTDKLEEITLTMNGEKVVCGTNYDNSIYTMSFDNYLKEKKEYLITVPKGVTTNGYSQSFKTLDGKYEVSLLDFKDVSGNVTTDVEEISSLDAKIINTAEKENDYRLLFTSYNGNILQNVVYKDFKVTKSDANVYVSVPLSVSTQADKVKHILWNKVSATLTHKGLVNCEISGEKTVTFSNVLTSKKAGAKVLILVYLPGMNESNLSELNDNNSVLAYCDYTEADAEGKYSFTFKIDNVTEYYDVTVLSDAGDKDIYKTFYNDKTKADSIRVDLNNAADADAFYNIIYDSNNNYEELGFYSGLTETVDNRKVSDLMYQYVNNVSKLDTDDNIGTIKLYKKMYGIQLLNESKNVSVDVLDDYLNMEEEKFYPFYSKTYVTDDVKNEIYMELKGREFKSEAEYKSAFIEELVLKTVHYADGYGNIRDILTEYKSETGIDNTNFGIDNYSAVSGRVYENYAALKTALLQVNNSYSGSYGGGTTSGGGGSPSKNDGIKLTVDNKLINTPVAVPVKTEIFTDIADYEWAEEAIEYLYENDVVSGKSNSEFKPQDNITREEFASIIVRAMGIEDNQSDVEFTDVPEDAWYAKYIKAAANAGLIYGREDSSFGVGENISRQDMAVIISRAIKTESSSNNTEVFDDDMNISDYAKSAVYAMRENNIISGFEDGTFRPMSEASRAQAAVMIYRAFYN